MMQIPFPEGNFTWTAAGAWASFFALIGLIVRQLGPWRKLSIDAEKAFRDDLIKRVTKLEKTLERQRLRHEAERGLDRHRLNNVTQCFDAMMMMLKASPEKAAEIIAHIEQMRANQLKAEALEKAAIHAALIRDVEDEPEEV
jgi:hypothetical protein